jgi:hypothetical protein
VRAGVDDPVRVGVLTVQGVRGHHGTGQVRQGAQDLGQGRDLITADHGDLAHDQAGIVVVGRDQLHLTVGSSGAAQHLAVHRDRAALLLSVRGARRLLGRWPGGQPPGQPGVDRPLQRGRIDRSQHSSERRHRGRRTRWGQLVIGSRGPGRHGHQ